MSARYARYDKLDIAFPVERVLRITFNRPETYNSVDAETHSQITEIWREIDVDPDVNVVLVTGAGKAFSSGGDFDMIERMIADPVVRMATWKEAKDLVYNIVNCNKPIVSAINGSRLARASSLGSSPTSRSPGSPPKSSTDTRGSVLRPATSPASSGRCFAGWRRRNTTC